MMDKALVTRIFYALLVVLGLITIISLIPTNRGAVRALDFVREPVFYLALGLAVLALVFARGARTILALGFVIVAGIQLARFWPYFDPAPETVALEGRSLPEACFAALSLNVLQSNGGHAAVAGLIDRIDPDLLLLMEVDETWMRALEPQISRYPETLAEPLDNKYGMAFATRLGVRRATMASPTSADTPTLYATLLAGNGRPFEFIGLHPRPPLPGESTEMRDANIARAGAFQTGRVPDALVMGDFNDVPWSRTTESFREAGNWRDPRIGRGTFPTFPADYAFVGWPLDQLMVRHGVRVRDFRLLDDVGSDHLPMYAELCVERGSADPVRPPQ